ncbi:DUF1707 domain-containing protein [Krasilnikovia sp. MM14-A1259]|uniref:DUF1707 SHOCT-like domain-containing protein n=1 Tax=Krasilnikovia sp. MM14-A1259 TaxID=3373539 RepID=UPI00381BD6D2
MHVAHVSNVRHRRAPGHPRAVASRLRPPEYAATAATPPGVRGRAGLRPRNRTRMLLRGDAARPGSGDSGVVSRPDLEVNVNMHDDTTWSGPNRLRTSDSEREQVATILRAAMGEGRLNLAEGEERLAAAYAATYRDELTRLTADLPGGGRPDLQETPQARTATRRGVRRHAGGVVVVAVVLVGLWALSGAHVFWPAIPLAFLFIGVVRHARYGGYRHHVYHHHGVAPWNR